MRHFGMGWYLNIVTVVMFSLCWWLWWGMMGLGIAFNVLNRIFGRKP